MSKLNQVICDICDKPIGNKGRIFHRYKIVSIETADDFYKKRKIDACPDCMREFQDFIKTKNMFKEVENVKSK